jgi:hypothetical protein
MSHGLYREKKSGIFKTNSPESLGTLAKIIDFLIFFIFFCLGQGQKISVLDLGQVATIHGMTFHDKLPI